MLFDNYASSAAMSYELAFMLGLIRNIDAEAQIRAYAATIKPNWILSRYYAGTATCPTFMLLGWSDMLLILIDGVTNVSQGTFYVDGIRVAPNWNSDGAMNPALVINRNRIMMAVNDLNWVIPPRVIIAGHSMGGAIAQAVLLGYQSEGLIASKSCVTFGSPKIGPPTCVGLFNSWDVQRWMNTQDPVPHVVPTVEQAPLFAAIVGPIGRSLMAQYCQTRGGAILAEDGSITEADLTHALAPTIQMNLASWLLACATNAATEHNISMYVARLLLAKNAVPPLPADRNHTTTAQQPPGGNTPEQLRIINEALATIRKDQLGSNASDLRIPDAEAFVAVKVAGVWIVKFRGESITVAPGRRRAVKLASLANRMLKVLQVQGRVDVDSFVDSFRSYLEDASDPASAFHPTMSV